MKLRKILRKIHNNMKYFLFPFLDYDNMPVGAILMLHRIDKPDETKLWSNEHLKLSCDCLEDLIIKLKSKGYKFVSLEELKITIEQKKKAKKLIAITLDDGYRDNFEKGLPIFKKHNVPICIYISTGMIEQQFIYWWYILEDLILSNTEIILNNNEKFDCSTKESKEQTFLTLRERILKLPQSALSKELPKLFSNYKVELNSYNENLPLTWSQINILAKEPLVTIGCHTHAHFSFNQCTEKEIIDDILLSRNLIKEKANIDSEHFCFPFGDKISISEKHIELLKKLNFKSAVTTQPGICRYDADVMQLPRIFVNEKNINDILKQLQEEL